MKIITLMAGAIVAICAGTGCTTAPAPESMQASTAPLITPSVLQTRLQQKDPDLVVLDVRTPEEFAAGHVPGARNISHGELSDRLAELASLKDKSLVLYCRSGKRAAIAEQTLRAAGFTRLLHLEGDFPAWEAWQQPLER